MKIHIDIETFCELDLKKVGMYRYASDSSTEILCLAYAIDDQPVQIWKEHTDVLLPKWLIEAISQSSTILYAHNAAFERTLLNSAAGKRIGFPTTSIVKWRCTAAIAAYHSLPRDLKRCAEVLKVTKKDTRGASSMLKLCKPRRASAKNASLRWTYKTAPQDFEKMYFYCMTDVIVERDIHNRLGELPLQELKIYWIDQHINDRGVCVDLALVRSIQKLSQQHKENLDQLFLSITDVHVTQREAIFNWLRRRHYPYEDIRADTIDAALKNDDNATWMTDEVRKVLKLRRVASKTSIAKYDAISRSASFDHKIRGMFLYHGASTGRWAGRIVQMQNLPRPIIKDIDTAIEVVKTKDLETVRLYYDSPNAVFSSLIRSAFVASPKKDLIVSDFGQIEARVLGWLAHEDNYTIAFENNEDIYKFQAAEIFNVPYDLVTDDQRQLGKVCVLALGYQMGLKKLIETVKSWGMSVEDSLLSKAFEGYREANSKIVKLWRDFNRASIASIEDCSCIKSFEVFMYRENDFFIIELPSGRKLHYFHPEIKEIETPWGHKRKVLHYRTLDSMSNQWVQKSTYGGKLVENVVQAIARDILSVSLQNVFINSKKYKIIGHIHDEIIAEVNDGEGDLEEFNSLMLSNMPLWAKEIFLVAEGYIAKRYKK